MGTDTIVAECTCSGQQCTGLGALFRQPLPTSASELNSPYFLLLTVKMPSSPTLTRCCPALPRNLRARMYSPALSSRSRSRKVPSGPSTILAEGCKWEGGGGGKGREGDESKLVTVWKTGGYFLCMGVCVCLCGGYAVYLPRLGDAERWHCLISFSAGGGIMPTCEQFVIAAAKQTHPLHPTWSVLPNSSQACHCA